MSKRYTFEDVKKIVEDVNYELLSLEKDIINDKGYVFTTTKIEVWCKNPNHKSELKVLADFKRGKSRCKQCKYSKHAEELKHSFDYIYNFIKLEGYELLSTEYKNNGEKLKIKCNKNHIFLMNFRDFQQGYRCPHCYNERRHEVKKYSTEYISKKIKEEGYTLLSEYKNSTSKIMLQCPNNHEYETEWSNFQQGRRCPICNESKGEKKVTEVLNKYNVKYIFQHKFNDCKFKNKLPFDFYLPDYDICIEYDGQQHFEPIDFSGKGYEYALDRFISCVINDTIKNDYCKKNNINLIRISYKDFDKIEEVIKNRINFND